MKQRLVNGLLIFALLAITVFSNVKPAQAAPAAEGITTAAEMETFLDGVIKAQMDENHIPGLVVTVVKDGQVFFAKGYGYSNLENQTPVSPAQTLFRVGSTSKLITSTAVMQLAEQGKLDLNADINNYLDFQIPATFSQPITLTNLLTHTAGFEERAMGVIVADPKNVAPLGDSLKNNIPARIYEPGKIGAYSNYGMALAGYIVERVSGMPYAEYIQKNIFTPLGMEHSTAQQPLPDNLVADLANGYGYVDGKQALGRFEWVQASPAGAISATADDMAKFMMAHLQNGTYNGATILSEATSQKMHDLPNFIDSRLKEDLAYGFVRQHVNGVLTLWHNGDTFLFHTGLHLLPEQNVGFFISNNGGNGGEVEAVVFRAFMNRYFPSQIETVPTPPADMSARAAQYSGEYYSSRVNTSGIEKILGLLARIQIVTDSSGYVHIPSTSGEKIGVEVEPGLVQVVDNSWQQVSFATNGNGQDYFVAGQSAAIKARWYETQLFHLALLGISILVLLLTLIGWGIGAIVRRIKKRQPEEKLPRLARYSGIAFIVLLLALIAGFVVVLSQGDPAFGMPLFLLGEPTALPAVLVIPFGMAIAGAALLIFAVIAWRKGFWNLLGRMHYTLVTLAAWAMLWELVFWNFLKL